MNSIYLARAGDVAARMIGGEMMVLSARDSKLFSLNETAAAIWQAADGKTPLSEIVQQHLCEDYDVDLDVATRDAEELVKGLASHGILKLSGIPMPETA
jgi:hypothetical protein